HLAQHQDAGHGQQRRQGLQREGHQRWQQRAHGRN
ncbi:hypothetical protein BN1708_020508, partial [Verticillium longisporum]